MKYDVRIFMNFPDVLTEEKITDYVSLAQMMMFGRYSDLEYGEFTMIRPTPEMIAKKQTYYIINFSCTGDVDCVTSEKVFDVVRSIYADIMVQVRDARFIGNGKKYYWSNDGQSTYSDGGTYVDPEYVFHVENDADYRVIYIPEYLKTKLKHSHLDRYREYENHTFMWEATSTWNNWLEANTLDNALAEFEQIYYAKLVKTVQARRESLAKSIDAVKDFAEYNGSIPDKSVCNGEVVNMLDNIIQYCRDQIGFEDYFERDRLISYLNELKERY